MNNFQLCGLRNIHNFVVFFVFLMLAAVSVAAQDTVPVTIEDLRQFRKTAVDRDYWKGVAEDRQSQLDAANRSAENWKKIAASETDRADRVQGGRVTETQAALTDLQKANFELHNQHTSDVRKIGEQNAEIISLKSARKYYFAFGALSGGVAGYVIGNKTANGGLIPGLPRSDDRRFGFKLNF